MPLANWTAYEWMDGKQNYTHFHNGKKSIKPLLSARIGLWIDRWVDVRSHSHSHYLMGSFLVRNIWCRFYGWSVSCFRFLLWFERFETRLKQFYLTYVQSVSWPQKKRVCRRWSPIPSRWAPCVYTHSGSPVNTHCSKSFFSHAGSGNGRSGNACLHLNKKKTKSFS